MQSIKQKRSSLSLLIGISMLMIINACTPPQQAESNIQIEAITSGPFFEGPNSLIAEKEVNYDQFIDGQTLSADQLKSVKIQSVGVTLRTMDSLDFSYFDDASISIVSPEIDMMSIATINPIESDGQSISLQTSEEAELVDYFKSGKYSLVLDLGLNQDIYIGELGATIDIKLNVEYKAQ